MISIVCLTFLVVLSSARWMPPAGSISLINRPDFDFLNDDYNVNHSRSKRYIGLSKRYKLNRRYQECVAPGEVEGHCKHVIYCPLDVVGISGKAALDYLCIIEKIHVGVCCPDDILLQSLTGAQLIMDLPAGGEEYEDEDAFTGCGLTELARPVGNRASSPAKRWPWLATLYKPSEGNRQFCGGALITDKHILTAAHCFNGLKANDFRVRLGEYDFGRAGETRSRDFSVSLISNHEEFSQGTYDNDISIITLDKSVNFNSYMWPICLPPLNASYEGLTATVAGWGQQYYAGPTSEVLLEVSVPIWEHKRCVDAFAQRISDTSLCAAAHEGGKDSCLGDSGGPLVYQLKNGRWVAIGIVSWGIGCGDRGLPGIYTRVDKYIPWIVKRTIVK